MAFNVSNSFIPPGAHYTGSSPGHWIGKDLQPQDFTVIDLKEWDERQHALEAHAVREGSSLPTGNPFAVNTYIYCPPCACQVATAYDICRSLKRFPNVDVRIRVDYHEKTSCSLMSSRIGGIASLVEHIKSLESVISHDDYGMERLTAIDRQWLELIINGYEEEVQAMATSPSERISNIVSSHKDEELCAAVIILGEADHCIPLVHASPFPLFKHGRTPKETEMFKLFQTYSFSSGQHWQRNFMGTYARKPQRKKRPIPATLETAESPSKRIATTESLQKSSQS